MKVYITSTPEFSFELVKEVVLLLNQTPGELEFLLGPPLTVPQLSLTNSKLKLIKTIDSLSFEEFFGLCDTYRTIKEIPIDAYVVIVTSIKNNMRWFSAFKEKNIFIHGLEWEYYTKKDAKYGIAYEVVENIFQSQIGLNIFGVNKEPHYHMESIGCINDMCMNKKDVMLKLRTADICDSCIDWAIEKKVNPLVLQHIKELIESLRKLFINSNRITSTVKPLVVHVDPKRSIKIGDKKVGIVALQKVLFIFFLKNPQGVKTKLVCDHQDELFDLYKEIRKSGVKERIERMFDSEKWPDPSFNSHKSKLNKALVRILGAKLAEFYIITKVIIKDSTHIYKINLEDDYIRIDPRS
jgi:hypothetical protein